MAKTATPATAAERSKPTTERAVFKIFIRGTIDAVWREITKTDSAQACMFDMVLATPGLAVGNPMQMRSKDGKVVGIVGEVIEWDPPRRYGHTFKFTRMDDPPCKVFYDLKEVTGGVEFTMTLEELPSGTATAKQMLMGGDLITATLKSVVETGKLPFKTRMIYGLINLTSIFGVPKQCRAENWPLKK